MISFNELEKGATIIMEGQPYEIIETSRMFKGRGHSVVPTKLKNLVNGNVVSKTFHPSDSFNEAEISRQEIKFLYANKGQYFFCQSDDPAQRFSLSIEQIGEQAKFLKAGQIAESLVFQDKQINISLPIKICLKVTEAPPAVQGNRSSPGNKMVTLETGANINTPLFIKEGDMIEINTQKREYVRRVD